MLPVVFFHDRFLEPGERASVSILDRGYLLGDSVFASTRSFAGRPLALDMHLTRFHEGARGLGLDVPSEGALEAIVREACERFGEGHGYVRVTASRGEGTPGLLPDPMATTTLSVVVRAMAAPFPAPVRVGVAGLRAPPAECLDPSWKLGSYAARVVMRREAAERGHGEAVVLGVTGDVVSGIASNVLVFEGPDVWTPALSVGCRPGVTRELCLRLLSSLGVSVTERRAGVDALARATSVVFTSALLPLVSAIAFDDLPLDVSPELLGKLRAAYEETTGLRPSRARS
ncbi:MAG: aminotransferase class IV [Polyangiaceae bacterium]